MKKRLILILVSLLLSGSFAACDMEFGGLVGELFGEGVGDYIPSDDFVPETAVEETWIETDVLVGEHPTSPEIWWDETECGTEPPIVELPENQFAGQELVVLQVKESDLGYFKDLDTTISEITFLRNQTVQEKYNFVITNAYAKHQDMANMVLNDFTAGTGEYDLVLGGMSSIGAPLAQKGVLTNLNDLPWLRPSSWDAGALTDLSIGGYLPMMTGEISPDVMLKTSLILYNKEFADQIGLDIHMYYEQGVWTLHNMQVMNMVAQSDLNGNSTMEMGDAFGLVCRPEDARAFAVGAGSLIVIKDGNNLPAYQDDIHHVQMIINNYSTFYQMFSLGALAINSGINAFTPMKEFVQGHALFMSATVKDALHLAQNDVAFGIMPYPTTEENASEYHSYVDSGAAAVMVPSNAPKDFVGYALEAMAKESEGMYYDRFSMRICSTAEDLDMLNLVMETKSFDFVSTYMNAAGPAVTNMFGVALENESPYLTSLLKQNQEVIENAIKDLIRMAEQ